VEVEVVEVQRESLQKTSHPNRKSKTSIFTGNLTNTIEENFKLCPQTTKGEEEVE
jgi:spore coat protein CotF